MKAELLLNLPSCKVVKLKSINVWIAPRFVDANGNFEIFFLDSRELSFLSVSIANHLSLSDLPLDTARSI